MAVDGPRIDQSLDTGGTTSEAPGHESFNLTYTGHDGLIAQPTNPERNLHAMNFVVAFLA